MIRVAIYRSGAPDRYVDIPQNVARIGRASENDIVLEDPEKGVSRIHAELRNEQGRWTVTDLNSQNGVHIRGRRVTRQVVEPGTAITVGPYQLVLEDTAVDAVPATEGTEATRGPGAIADPSAADARPSAVPRPAVPPRRGGGIPHLVPIVAAAVLLLLAVGAFAWLKMGAQEETPPTTPVVQDPKPPEPEPAPPTETPLQQQVRTATEKLDAGDLDGAAAAIDEALKLGPDNAEALALKTRLDEARAALAPPPTDPAVTAGPVTIPDWPSDWPKPARRERESASTYIKRAQDIQRQYNTGSSSLERGEIPLAISSFETVIGLEPGFHDAPQKLQRAKQVQQAAQAREEAGRAFDAGRRAERERDIGAAITQYERAVGLDPSRKDAAESVDRLRTYVNQTVPAIRKEARIAEAYGERQKAAAQLEQVLKLLPEGDSRRREIEQELKRLRGGQ